MGEQRPPPLGNPAHTRYSRNHVLFKLSSSHNLMHHTFTMLPATAVRAQYRVRELALRRESKK